MKKLFVYGLFLLAAAAATNDAVPANIPLTDLGAGLYLGAYQGGLYPNGSNVIPAAHATIGAQQAKLIQPLDTNGNPSATGKIVFMSLGMSHTALDFGGIVAGDTLQFMPESFIGQATNDPAVNHTTLLMLNGAQGSQPAQYWSDQTIIKPGSTQNNYDRVRDHVLTPAGVTEKQVQVIWIKQADPQPTVSLFSSGGSATSDAYVLEGYLGMILRVVKVRYPNIRQVFITSRSYGGFSNGDLNPEPYAYETGFSVKWTVQAQINQMSGGTVDPIAGDLNYNTVAPFIAWGPYTWANGTQPRSDGLVYFPSDFRDDDAVHPSQPQGIQKVATQIVSFFKTSTLTSCWFLAGKTCP